jgi:hypothetical protein
VIHYTLNIKPDNALVHLEGMPTKATGPRRMFVSPEVKPSARYTLQIVVHWREQQRSVAWQQTAVAGDTVSRNIELVDGVVYLDGVETPSLSTKPVVIDANPKEVKPPVVDQGPPPEVKPPIIDPDQQGSSRSTTKPLVIDQGPPQDAPKSRVTDDSGTEPTEHEVRIPLPVLRIIANVFLDWMFASRPSPVPPPLLPDLPKPDSLKPAPTTPLITEKPPQNMGLDQDWANTPVTRERISVSGYQVDDRTIGNSLANLPDDAKKNHVTIFWKQKHSTAAANVMTKLAGAIDAKLDSYCVDDPKNAWRVSPFKLDEDRRFQEAEYKLIVQGPIRQDGTAKDMGSTYTPTPEAALQAYRKAVPDYKPDTSPPLPTLGGDQWQQIVIVAAIVIAAIFMVLMMPQRQVLQQRTRRGRREWD